MNAISEMRLRGTERGAVARCGERSSPAHRRPARRRRQHLGRAAARSSSSRRCWRWVCRRCSRTRPTPMRPCPAMSRAPSVCGKTSSRYRDRLLPYRRDVGDLRLCRRRVAAPRLGTLSSLSSMPWLMAVRCGALHLRRADQQLSSSGARRNASRGAKAAGRSAAAHRPRGDLDLWRVLQCRAGRAAAGVPRRRRHRQHPRRQRHQALYHREHVIAAGRRGPLCDRRRDRLVSRAPSRWSG